jgi:hypothetical protein
MRKVECQQAMSRIESFARPVRVGPFLVTLFVNHNRIGRRPVDQLLEYFDKVLNF